MRILIVSEIFAPAVSGVAVTTARLAANLAERGHIVQVLTASQGDGSASIETRNGYEIVRIASLANPFRKGFRLTVMAGRAVKLTFDEFQPEIVHIQDPISLSVRAVYEAKKRNIPVVATHHFLPDYVFSYLPDSVPVQNLARFWLRRRLVRLYSKCVCLTVPTETVRRAVEGADLLTCIRVISNGVDTDRFAPGTEKTDPPTVLYVGRLDPEKNISTLLRACAKLRQPYQLRIIGGGNLIESLREQAKDLPVTWVAPVETESEILAAAYREASIFCISSPHETESMVTLEAMAAGLPVLAADGGALPELINGNGYLLPAHQTTAWTSAMEELLADAGLRAEMGTISRQRSLERAIGLSVDAIEKLYSEVHLV